MQRRRPPARPTAPASPLGYIAKHPLQLTSSRPQSSAKSPTSTPLAPSASESRSSSMPKQKERCWVRRVSLLRFSPTSSPTASPPASPGPSLSPQQDAPPPHPTYLP